VLQWRNQDEFTAKFHSIAYVCKSEDVLDLPEQLHNRIDVEMPVKAVQLYKDLDDKFIAYIEEGSINVQHALVQLLRMQQVSSGSVGTDQGNVVCVHNAKRDALLDLCSDIDPSEPVVVFCRFRHDLCMVRSVAEALGRKYGEISGRQKDLTPNATIPDGIGIMGVQIQAGGVGVDLSKARSCKA
jgi:hypothetical protein